METDTDARGTEVLRAGEADLARFEETAASRNPATVYLASLGSENSRRTMRTALTRAGRVLTGEKLEPEVIPWSEVRYPHVAALRSRLREEHAPSTVNQTLTAVRNVVREAWRLGHVEPEVYLRVSEVGDVTDETLPSGRRLTLGELFALKQSCEADEGPAGARDKALLAALARGGLRRDEATRLTVEDFTPEADEEGVGELRVHDGKGHGRIVSIANGAREAIVGWIEVRGREPEGALFVPIDRWGNLTYRHLTGQAVYGILQRRAEKAGVESFTPHDLRRTFASDLLEHGNDLSVTKALMGHSSTDTTTRYDHRGQAAKRKPAARLPF